MARDATTKKRKIERFEDLPAWYHRVRRQIRRDEPHTEDELDEEDFDEDISELHEDERDEEDDFECTCEAMDDSDYGCECGPEVDSLADAASEATYDGFDAGHYYELKEKRIERKLDLEEQREGDEIQKKRTVESHKLRVKEVRAARKALKKEKKVEKGQPISFLSQSGLIGYKGYDLYSTDFMKHCWQDDYYNYWKRVDFEEYPENDNYGKSQAKSPGGNGKTPSAEAKAGRTVHCRIYASPSHEPALRPFRAPSHLNLKTRNIKAKNGKYKIAIKFIGQDYLKMKVPRHVIKSNGFPRVSDSAPEVFEFVGISCNYNKRKAEA